MQDAPDAVLQVIREQHQDPFVQAWAAEVLSRRAEQRFRAVVPKGCKAEEAARLIREAIQVDLDAAEANAVAEDGQVIDRAIKSRRYRDQVTAFRRETAGKRVQDFIRRAAQDVLGCRAALETLKLYLRKAITGAQFRVEINTHLQPYPVVYQIDMVHVRGQENWTLDDGWASNGWLALGLLIQEHVSLRRFRLCPVCDALFYDASHAGNKKLCGESDCKRLWKRVRKQEERSRKRAE
jgi:predicted RNA-binding Zn ribbon-like protein